MKYYLRDSDLPLPEGDTRFAHLDRVRVDRLRPHVTAERLAAAGRDVYLQFYFDDPEGVELPDQDTRRKYWREYTGVLAKLLEDASVVKDFIAVEHPSLGWDSANGRAYRHDPLWYEVYGEVHEMLEELTGARVTQFGYPDSGLVMYQFPLNPQLPELGSGDLECAWVNLPGQHAFGDHFTRMPEFVAFHAICTELRVDHVVLWSNPARSPSEEYWEEIVERIHAVSPPPPEPGPGWGTTEGFLSFLRKLAKRGRGG